MTIDERLEALTQSLELFASITQSSFEHMTKRMDERDEYLDGMLRNLVVNQDRLERTVDQLGQRMDQMAERMDDMAVKIIAPIARLVLAHEQRLNRLDPEGQVPDTPTQ